MVDKDIRTPKVVSQSDQVLAARLTEALRAVDGVVIEAVANGEVTLAGVVPSAAIAADIAAVAGEVEGVVAVNADRVAVGEPEADDDYDWPPMMPPGRLNY